MIAELQTLTADMKMMTFTQIPATLATSNPAVMKALQAKLAAARQQKQEEDAAKEKEDGDDVICID